jgi:hypothetical protein
MYDRLILLDYDVGALGNTIFALCSLTSKNVCGVANRSFQFSNTGNAHSISKFDPQFPTGKFLAPIRYQSPGFGQFDMRIGHAWNTYKSLQKQYTGCAYIKVVVGKLGLLYQTLAGYQKFSGHPTLDTAHNYFNIIDPSENGVIESFALCYWDILNQHKQYRLDREIHCLDLDLVLETELSYVVDFFTHTLSFEFDNMQVATFQDQWRLANHSLLNRAKELYNVVTNVRNGVSVDYPDNFKFYEKALVLALTAQQDVSQMSLYDQDFWHNTDILINNLQRKNHGQTL